MMTKSALFGAVWLMSVAGVVSNTIEIRGGVGGPVGGVPHVVAPAHNGMRVFPDLNDGLSQMHDFPEHYLAGAYHIASPDDHRLAQGTEVRFHCAAGSGPCEAVVFVYECAPCKSRTGGLPGFLLLHGFQRTRCTPTFSVDADSTHHKFTGFGKILADGTDEVIALPNDAEFVLFGLSNGGTPQCGELAAETLCEDGSRGRCEWKEFAPGPKCQFARCISKGPSSGGCEKCLQDDIPR